MKRYLKNIIMLSLLALIILNFYFLRSIFFMYGYNKVNLNKSFVKDKEIQINIPKETNLDWYPLMNMYNAENFHKYINKDVDLVVYYTFGEFNGRYSNIFRQNSPTYSSFYGSYILKKNTQDDFYIYDKDNSLIVEDIVDILVYDYKYLVLKPLGYKKEVDIEYNIVEKLEDEGRTILTTEIFMNGLGHNFDKFNSNYIQYGTPDNVNETEFERIKSYGKFIVERPKDNIYIIHYLINKDKSIIEQWGD